MANLSYTNVKLINTYLSLVPAAYKVGERRLIFDRIQGMTNRQLETFLRGKIGEDFNTTVGNDSVQQVCCVHC